MGLKLAAVVGEDILLGYCDINAIRYGDKVAIPGFVNRLTHNPKDILPEGKTIITVAKPIKPEEDIYRNGILFHTYPAYGGVFKESEKLRDFLLSADFKAILARRIDQKDAAIQCGLGVRGKQSLIINPKYGTNLRVDTIITDWQPEEYSVPMTQNLCEGCNRCVSDCTHGCLVEGEINRVLCYKHYIPDRNRIGLSPICRLCQTNCRYNK